MTSGLTISWNLEKCAWRWVDDCARGRSNYQKIQRLAYIMLAVGSLTWLSICLSMKAMITCALENSPQICWEKALSKFRQCSGGAYFINVQQVSEKFRIQKAKLQVTLNNELISSSLPSTHRCDNCEYILNIEESEMFNQLPLLESDVSKETMSNIVHIAGHVCRKSISEDEDETYHYYEKYGKFTKLS